MKATVARVECAILGAGAVGVATACHRVLRGEPTWLIEQFEVGHDRGSSHGDARIIRHSYADPLYAELMPEAYRCWRSLEADSGRSFYIRTGGVSFGPTGAGYVERVATNLVTTGIPHRRMTGREWNHAHPCFRISDEHDVIFEPDAGMIAAASAIRCQLDLARERGGDHFRLVDRCPIRRIDLDGPSPVLLGDGLQIVADRLIVAAGPWAGRLLPGLADDLRPTRQRVLYVRPEPIDPFLVGRFPVFISMGADPAAAYYGMPSFLGGGVKLARHGGPETDPDLDERAIGPEYMDEIREFLREHVPSLAQAAVVRLETCLYTMADGEHFVVGPLPGRPDVLVASPCSGHGFKFSPLIGRLLAALARGEDPGFSPKAWRVPDRSPH